MNSTKTYLQHLQWIIDTCVLIKTKNPLFGVVSLCARMRTSLHASPMLRINRPFPTRSFGPHPCPQISPSILWTHTSDIFNRQKTTSTRWNLLMSGTLNIHIYTVFCKCSTLVFLYTYTDVSSPVTSLQIHLRFYNIKYGMHCHFSEENTYIRSTMSWPGVQDYIFFGQWILILQKTAQR